MTKNIVGIILIAIICAVASGVIAQITGTHHGDYFCGTVYGYCAGPLVTELVKRGRHWLNLGPGTLTHDERGDRR